MSKLVSIVVPVYNRERSIESCLNSIAHIHYQDYEVIIVDDGSSDNTAQICDTFCTSHKKFRCIHQNNGGVSNARNRALCEANGEWITFIDSDDLVCPEHLNVVELESRNDVDWIIESFQMIGTVKGEIQIPSIFENSFQERVETTEPVEYVFTDMLKTNTPLFSTCGKFFKKSICTQHRIQFDERLSLDEDQLFVSTYMQYVHKMVHYPLVRSYLFLDWGDMHLSGKLHTPEKYMEGYEANYNAFMKLDNRENSSCAHYAASYMINSSMHNILFRYNRPKYQLLYSTQILQQFIEDRIYPYYTRFKHPIGNVAFPYMCAYRLVKHHYIKLAIYYCKLYNLYKSIVFKLKHK
jgi:hypothetical protein